jgi:transglycosylase-like protein with SLT domain
VGSERDVQIRPSAPQVTVTAEPPKPGPDVLESPPPKVLAQLRLAGSLAVDRTRTWARRPGGRVLIPALLIFAMLAVAFVAGRFYAPDASVVSNKQPATPPSAALAQPEGSATLDPQASATPAPIGTLDGSGAPVGGVTGRPAEVLANWAVPMAIKVNIPVVALEAYGYAELVVRHNQPACNLSWTTLAGIGKIESDHGRAQGAKLGTDGKALPAIIGPPLDGQGGRKSIPDTDGGTLDTDRSWDRAVGPMQFLPSTWKQYAVDADNDGVTDINDIDDAALAAGDYLCAGGRDLATPQGWKAAIASYNAVDPYLQDVYNATDNYGRLSRG